MLQNDYKTLKRAVLYYTSITITDSNVKDGLQFALFPDILLILL